MSKKKKDKTSLILYILNKHFENISIPELIVAQRTFPSTSRADLQRALELIFQNNHQTRLYGAHRDYGISALKFSDFLETSHSAVKIGPLQYDEVDIGDERPARCLNEGVWVCDKEKTPFAVVISKSERHSDESILISIAVPPGEKGLDLSETFLQNLELEVNRSGSYRGKVISLEAGSRYSGKGGSVRVHKLHNVDREEVILPPATLKLLDRNVNEFIAQRNNLRDLGMALKKGLLFYGPPGTGKTHTIHYLANQLPDHTTLLITAGQIGLLDEYCLLARFLQPAMIVIEDADLIARDRQQMNSAVEESLLNKLLNEMDGLREDAEILFVLTTNRPEQLEAALASRPGRIDQAIEFPLPDEDGRGKLVKLYAKGLKLAPGLLELIVKRTESASAAFIKELMRRAAQQFLLEPSNKELQAEHVALALEDMLFSGGSLNVKLLGGSLGAAAKRN